MRSNGLFIVPRTLRLNRNVWADATKPNFRRSIHLLRLFKSSDFLNDFSKEIIRLFGIIELVLSLSLFLQAGHFLKIFGARDRLRLLASSHVGR